MLAFDHAGYHPQRPEDASLLGSRLLIWIIPGVVHPLYSHEMKTQVFSSITLLDFDTGYFKQGKIVTASFFIYTPNSMGVHDNPD